MVYLTVLKRNTNQATHNIWHYSGSTESKFITEVAYAFERVNKRLLIDPRIDTPEEISSNSKFSPFFDNCMMDVIVQQQPVIPIFEIVSNFFRKTFLLLLILI